MAQKGEKQSREHLKIISGVRSSNFSFTKSVSAASVTRHIAQISTTKLKVSLKIKNMSGKELVEATLLKGQDISTCRSAKAIEAHLIAESLKNLSANTPIDNQAFKRRPKLASHDHRKHDKLMESHRKLENETISQSVNYLKYDIQEFQKDASNYKHYQRYVFNLEICLIH